MRGRFHRAGDPLPPDWYRVDANGRGWPAHFGSVTFESDAVSHLREDGSRLIVGFGLPILSMRDCHYVDVGITTPTELQLPDGSRQWLPPLPNKSWARL